MRLTRFMILWICLLFIITLPAATAAAAFAAPVLITHKEIQNERVTAFIPQISGLADQTIEESLNHVIRKDVEHDISKFLHNWDTVLANSPEYVKKDMHFWATYLVKLNKNGLLSLTISEYMYTGGAHGNTVVYAYTMNVATGQVYNLHDVFSPGEEYRPQLEKIIKEEIISRGIASYWFKQLDHSPLFYLTEEGLVIYFQPYEIGPWSIGVPRFVISYEKLGHRINRDLLLY